MPPRAPKRRALKPPGPRPFPSLKSLHKRHRGFYDHVCWVCSDAAAVRLDVHHKPPAQVLVETDGAQTIRLLRWTPASQKVRDGQANVDDAKRDGAYAVALATVEVEWGLFAIMRAETRTGSDWYVGALGAPDLEEAFRLEVSGTDGDTPGVRSRLKQKVSQAQHGNSNLPALACVVGFKAKHVMLSKVPPIGGKP